jgi:hypothetical protein
MRRCADFAESIPKERLLPARKQLTEIKYLNCDPQLITPSSEDNPNFRPNSSAVSQLSGEWSSIRSAILSAKPGS